MRVDVITLFPAMFAALTDFGVVGRAIQTGKLAFSTWNVRDYTQDNYRRVDDRPYGGGPGMVMMAPPLYDTVLATRQQCGHDGPVIYLTPQGEPLKQCTLQQLVKQPGLIVICGRYEGVDERLINACVDQQYSVGDYVLSGGELAAMVLIDGVTRLLPGVLGHSESSQQDSFSQLLLEYPHYTRPEAFAGQTVPDVLRSGDHQAIARWRSKQAIGRTWERRPDLLEQAELDAQQQRLLVEYREEKHAQDKQD